MENIDKGLTVPKWVLIVRPKIPQRPKIYLPNLSAQAQKFWISMKKASLGVPSLWVNLSLPKDWLGWSSFFFGLDNLKTKQKSFHLDHMIDIYSLINNSCVRWNVRFLHFLNPRRKNPIQVNKLSNPCLYLVT